MATQTKHTVNLDDQHLYNGVVYGPGQVQVEDEATAKALQASHERVSKSRAPGTTVRGPDGMMTGILHGTQGSPTKGANTFTPQDAVAQREASERAANQQKENEDAAKKAAAEAKK